MSRNSEDCKSVPASVPRHIRQYMKEHNTSATIAIREWYDLEMESGEDDRLELREAQLESELMLIKKRRELAKQRRERMIELEKRKQSGRRY